jgi:membrane protease YdiL (CAAX protease family)
MTASTPRQETALREGLRVWVGVVAALAVAKVTIGLIPSWGGSIVGALAVGLFLWAPTEMAKRKRRPDEDYGLNLREWPKDLAFALVVMAIVFPIFVAGFRGFLWFVDHKLPRDVASVLTPYVAGSHFRWRAPDDLLNKVAGNIAVAISEEFFYRGYLLARFSEYWPPRTRLLGAPFGKAMWLQTALFALGHLLTPQAFRLGTFFPGLLFGWMAARTGRVVAPAIVHAASNLLIATLEASAFGP